jgi:tetratricopeptide (TPR) repeat protein
MLVCFFLSYYGSKLVGIEISSEVQELLDESRALRGTAESSAKGLLVAGKAIEKAIDLADERSLIMAREDMAIHHYFLGEYSKGMGVLGVALNSARFHKFVDLEARLLNSLGIFYWKNGDLGEALRILKQTVDLARAHDLLVTVAPAKNNMGIVYFQLQQFDDAIRCYEIAIELNRELNDDELLARYLSNLAEALIQKGDLGRVETLLDESMVIEKRLGDPISIAYTYFNFGEFYSQAKLYDRAMLYYNRALEMQKELEYEYGISMTKMRMAQDFENQGQVEKAHEVIDRGLVLAQRLQVQPLLASYYEILAQLAEREDDSRLAAFYEFLAANFREDAQGVSLNAASDMAAHSIANTGAQASFGGRFSGSFLEYIERGLIVLLSLCLLGLLVSHLKLRRQQ